MQTKTLKAQLRTVIRTLTVPLLTIISVLIGVLSWFAFRSVVAYLLVVQESVGYASAAIHNFSFLIYGVGLLIFSLMVKYYYDAGQLNHTLKFRFLKVSIVQGIYFLLILLIWLIF